MAASTAETAPTKRGQRTRRALLDAALEFMESGRSFNSLSMREVARRAGLVPSAFYRHFQDMDQLGLALVSDVGQSLRPLLRQARLEGASADDRIRDSLLTYKKFVEEHPRYFLVASGERHGGAPVIRAAIRQEIERFIDEMQEDLTALNLLPNLAPESIRMVCDLVVNTMLNYASEMLDLGKSRRPAAQARIETYIRQLRMIFFGAALWRDSSAP